MTDLKKTRNTNKHIIFFFAGSEISANYALFSTSNLIGINQYQFLLPSVESAKLDMRNDYVSLTFIKSKFN